MKRFSKGLWKWLWEIDRNPDYDGETNMPGFAVILIVLLSCGWPLILVAWGKC